MLYNTLFEHCSVNVTFFYPQGYKTFLKISMCDIDHYGIINLERKFISDVINKQNELDKCVQ